MAVLRVNVTNVNVRLAAVTTRQRWSQGQMIPGTLEYSLRSYVHLFTVACIIFALYAARIALPYCWSAQQALYRGIS